MSSCTMPPKFAGKETQKQRGRRKEKPSPPTPWIELPPEIITDILHRLGAVEILKTAQKVCTTWRSVCKDPSMWRVIDMRIDSLTDDMVLVEMCRHAVDRSQGQLVEINLQYFASDELLDYIATRSGNLRRLRLFSCYYSSNECMTEAIKRFPNLESLNVTAVPVPNFSTKTIEMVGRSCPLLRSFALNKTSFGRSQCTKDEEAFAIARSMPGLRHLQLLRNGLTNEGLEAILHGCPHLETLDLRGCYDVKLIRDLEKRSSTHIKCLKYSKHVVSDDEYEMYDPIRYRDVDFGSNSD